jgi:hypothetical protein
MAPDKLTSQLNLGYPLPGRKELSAIIKKKEEVP